MAAKDQYLIDGEISFNPEVSFKPPSSRPRRDRRDRGRYDNQRRNNRPSGPKVNLKPVQVQGTSGAVKKKSGDQAPRVQQPNVPNYPGIPNYQAPASPMQQPTTIRYPKSLRKRRKYYNKTPSVPGYPGVPAYPGVPNYPNMDGLPGYANVPAYPGVPGAQLNAISNYKHGSEDLMDYRNRNRPGAGRADTEPAPYGAWFMGQPFPHSSREQQVGYVDPGNRGRHNFDGWDDPYYGDGGYGYPYYGGGGGGGGGGYTPAKDWVNLLSAMWRIPAK